MCHFIGIASIFFALGSVPAGAVLCLTESTVPNVCIAGMTNRFVVFEGRSGRVLYTGNDISGPVTALAIDRNRKLLAVASGRAAEKNVIDLYNLDDKGAPSKHSARLTGLSDQIYSMAYQPKMDGVLAAAGYGRKIHFWNMSSLEEVLVIKDHSDAIRNLNWHPTGASLASCSCDRTVKVWEYPSGRCAYSLNECTDWVYASRWINDGNGIAACGVDRAVRVWDVLAETISLRKSRLAHDAAVLDLAEIHDAVLSLGEDGVLKKWSTVDLVSKGQLKVLTQTPSCFCVSGDKENAWIAGYDANIYLVNLRRMMPEAVFSLVVPPRIDSFEPQTLPRGSRNRIRIKGINLDSADWQNARIEGGLIDLIDIADEGNSAEIEIEFASESVPGTRRVQVPLLDKKDYLEIPIQVILEEQFFDPKGIKSASVRGKILKAGHVVHHYITVTKGQELGVLLEQEPGSNLECRFSIRGPEGKMLASGKQLFPIQISQSGILDISVYDREFRIGSANYWLHVGRFPVSSGVFPTHVQSGQAAKVRLMGINLGNSFDIDLPNPVDFTQGNRVILPRPWKNIPGAIGPILDSLPQKQDPSLTYVPPFGASGVLGPTKINEKWNFSALRGQKLVLEIMASRLGASLDSFLEIRDSKDQPLVRTILQPVDQTTVSFRNHDPKSPGIRIEKWGGLVPNDYLYAGGDLMRIRALPRNPDDDCQFFASAGKRLAWYGTTPTHHPIGQTLLKVIPRNPGEPLENAGWPPVSLFWVNDDGDPEIGTDSRLVFDPPGNGVYKAVVSSSSGQLDLDTPYHLTVRPVSEGFSVSLRAMQTNIAPGGAAEILVDIKRTDGWEGAIHAQITGLASEWTASQGHASPAENTLLLLVESRGTKTNPPGEKAKIKITGMVENQPIVRELPLPKINWMESGDVIVRPEQTILDLMPGRKVRLPVVIQRMNGFEGRVPLDVRGLPQGIRVLDVGLNGILVPPAQTKRVLEIEADNWVPPCSIPLAIASRREGKPEYIGPSVTLNITKNGN